jgi:hypothetical protein
MPAELLQIGREALPLLTTKRGPATHGPTMLKTSGRSKFMVKTTLLEIASKYTRSWQDRS